jgi:hypothetical protein
MLLTTLAGNAAAHLRLCLSDESSLMMLVQVLGRHAVGLDPDPTRKVTPLGPSARATAGY